MKFVMEVHLEAPFRDTDIQDMEAFLADKAQGFTTVQSEMAEFLQSGGFINAKVNKIDYVEVGTDEKY